MRSKQEKHAPIDERQRLSRSVLWQLQRNYFERQGIEAWRAGTVPHHITSSPFIADAYAKIVLGFLREFKGLAQPVYIVELGSGSARFAYLFLKKFLDRQASSLLKEIPIKYVMTDFTDGIVEYWRTQPKLQPFIEKGLVDFARFDVERDQELTLLNANETISATNPKSPLVVIANYLFDSIPQDAFLTAGGQLFETLVTLSTPQTERDPSDPEILSRMEISCDHNPVKGDYYADPDWNRLLLDYQNRLPGTQFLFPTAALKCIQNLHRLANGHLLLLSGDRGYSRDEALLHGQGLPTMAVHGSISMMVDYQIIGEYCRNLGAAVLHPTRNALSLNISAFIFGAAADGVVETREAYDEAIEHFGPDDFSVLKEGVDKIYDALSLDQILAFLRLSCWDYRRFWECLPALKKLLPDISDEQKQRLRSAILNVWDSYLPIGEEKDLAFAMGTLLLEMDFYTEAFKFLQHSVDLYGISAGTAYNMGVCCYYLGELEQAFWYVHQALELEPAFDAASSLHGELLLQNE
jgi:tetratricopeptide (TPR) repeat protein